MSVQKRVHCGIVSLARTTSSGALGIVASGNACVNACVHAYARAYSSGVDLGRLWVDFGGGAVDSRSTCGRFEAVDLGPCCGALAIDLKSTWGRLEGEYGSREAPSCWPTPVRTTTGCHCLAPRSVASLATQRTRAREGAQPRTNPAGGPPRGQPGRGEGRNGPISDATWLSLGRNQANSGRNRSTPTESWPTLNRQNRDGLGRIEPESNICSEVT